MPNSFEQTVTIHAPIQVVWESLTQTEQMARWMGEHDLEIRVETDWTIGGPIVVHGFHHVRFQNIGKVVAFKPMERLIYTHLSSLSRLPDVPANHTTLDFHLDSLGSATSLALVASGFPTDSIFKHLQFYWGGTLACLKRHVEQRFSGESGNSDQNTG
jgi:uncharacterized protein YndB with AHSA1/START domain